MPNARHVPLLLCHEQFNEASLPAHTQDFSPLLCQIFLHACEIFLHSQMENLQEFLRIL